MSERQSTEDSGRSLLIRNALDLLNDIHPEDLSIREVARRAGLSSGAPYHHFETKTELLAACAVVAWTDLCEQLETDGDGDPRDRLIQRATAYLSFARTNPGPYHLITSRLLDDDHRFAEIVELRARAMGGTIALIIAATGSRIDEPTAKFRGIAMWSLLHGHLTLGNEIDGDAPPPIDADQAIGQLATQMALLPAGHPRPQD